MNRSLRLLRPAAASSLRVAQPPRVLVRPSVLQALQPQGQLQPARHAIDSARLFSAPSAPRFAAKDEDAKSKDAKDKDTKGAAAPAAGAKKPPAPAPPANKSDSEGANHSYVDQGLVTGAVSEARALVHDVADMISGKSSTHPTAFGGATSAIKPGSEKGGVMAANESSSSHGSISEDFTSITKGLVEAIPEHIRKFGLLGTVPYIGTAAGTVFFAREANRVQEGLTPLTGMDYQSIVSYLHTLEEIQITYGAVILSFLGALHWGMEFVKYGGEQGYSRLVLGTMPLLFAWPTTFMSHGVALAFQWTAFTGTWFLDQRASVNGWTPPWFATYRFYLSIIVGFSIIGTLSGTSYYGVGSGSAMDPTAAGADGQRYAGIDRTAKGRAHRQGLRGLHEVPFTEKGKRQPISHTGEDGTVRGRTKGAVYVEQEEGLEAYGRLKNKTKEVEEEEEEEEEESGGADDAAEDKEEGGEAAGAKEAEGEGESKKEGGEEKGAAGEKYTGMR